jgi:4-hydroxybenzoate polyprenyltransferase
MIKSVVQLLRPQQWIKNIFIFLPVFFDGKLLHIDLLLATAMVFVAYCLAASGVYCFNDVYDAEADRLHPKKCLRPIASGTVSKTAAYSIMGVCFLISILLVTISFHDEYPKMLRLIGVITFYILMNIAYCVKLKQKAIVDVFIIATGFVLRIVAGGFATGIHLSQWIVLMTFLLALFLAFAKRRDDVVIYEDTGILTRKNVSRYNLAFMNQAIGIVASITMVCYIMYTVSPEVTERFHSHYVYITSIFVLAGIIRYLQVTLVDVRSGSPTKILLKDRFIQACIIGWVITFFFILYF